jgi:glycosyltransferase involved in cell wall biosynthesis
MLPSFAENYTIQGELPVPVINDLSLPLVSIVTPSYNQGEYIRETIESVLTQDYPNIEYWVIDARSTDQTLAILREYEHDPRFHWISEPDRGQSDAINKGLGRSQGEIFGWLNSDDVLLPHALSRIVDGWRTFGQDAIVYGLGRYIDKRGTDLGYCPAQSSNMSFEKVLWVGKHNFIQPATFASTAAIRKVGGIDLSFHYALDLDLWVRLAEILPIKFIPHDIALYRLHSTSKTVSSPSSFIKDVRRVLDSAVQRGTISPRKAQSRYHLFAVRTYLMPGTINLTAAFGNLYSGVMAEPAVLPEAILVLLKAAVRLAVGDRLWAWARLVKARLG